MPKTSTRKPIKPVLDLGHCEVEMFRQYDGEDTWGGTVHFFGYPHHFTAVRVKEGPPNGDLWVATNDPNRRLDDYYNVYDYAPCPAKIPGLEGDFVILIHPHGD